jgi:ribosomal protein S2
MATKKEIDDRIREEGYVVSAFTKSERKEVAYLIDAEKRGEDVLDGIFCMVRRPEWLGIHEPTEEGNKG